MLSKSRRAILDELVIASEYKGLVWTYPEELEELISSGKVQGPLDSAEFRKNRCIMRAERRCWRSAARHAKKKNYEIVAVDLGGYSRAYDWTATFEFYRIRC